VLTYAVSVVSLTASVNSVKGGNRMVMKFCIGVGVPDIITHANLGDDRFRGF